MKNAVTFITTMQIPSLLEVRRYYPDWLTTFAVLHKCKHSTHGLIGSWKWQLVETSFIMMNLKSTLWEFFDRRIRSSHWNIEFFFDRAVILALTFNVKKYLQFLVNWKISFISRQLELSTCQNDLVLFDTITCDSTFLRLFKSKLFNDLNYLRNTVLILRSEEIFAAMLTSRQ